MRLSFLISTIFLYTLQTHTTELLAMPEPPASEQEIRRSLFLLKPVIKNLRTRACKHNPYKNRQSQVKFGPRSKQETQFIARKRKRIGERLNISKPPNVALCLSGGGFRAMLGALGFLKGLQETGILDLILYTASLSGSSWGVASWISAGVTLDKFYAQLRLNLKTSLKKGELPTIIPPKLKQISKKLITKYIFEQPISSVDLYGAIMINEILHHMPNAQNLKMSDQQRHIERDNLFLPLYTAVSPYSSDSSICYEWFEFNPYVARNIKNNAYTKIWAFGRKYENSLSVSHEGESELLFPPELPLSNFLGIFGSAFTLAPQELFNMLVNNEPDTIKVSILNAIMAQEFLAHGRIFSTKVFNPIYNLFPYSSNIDPKHISLIDAGIHFNLPLPPLLQRTKYINVIIVFDMSNDYMNGAPALRSAQNYAREKMLPFPNIDYKDITTSKISVFKKAGAPTIIYIPFINSCLDTFCGTFNFNYTLEQMDYVFNQARCLAVNASDRILKSITPNHPYQF